MEKEGNVYQCNKKRKNENSPAIKNATEASEIHHRQNFMGWEKYFMGIAFLARQRSKDPKYQVGACIVNNDKQIVGVGYNGMPSGCSDVIMPWKKDEAPLDSKHSYVCHAESNAIMFRNSVDVKDCTIYTTLYPCNECAKVIIQTGITKVIYFSDEKAHKDEYKAAKRMFETANPKRLNVPKVTCVPYEGNRDTILIEFSTKNLSA